MLHHPALRRIMWEPDCENKTRQEPENVKNFYSLQNGIVSITCIASAFQKENSQNNSKPSPRFISTNRNLSRLLLTQHSISLTVVLESMKLQRRATFYLESLI